VTKVPRRASGGAPVLFVMIDGVRPEALSLASCPALGRLRARGASTLEAQSVMPSMTLPCHLSIFWSASPDRHGVLSNEWRPMSCSHPGLFELARHHHLRSSAVYNWGPLRYISEPESLDSAFFLNNLLTEEGDDRVTDLAIAHLKKESPHLLFVYLGAADVAGHDHQFLSDRYLGKVEQVDRNLGRLVEALPAQAHVLVHSDHGGHEWTHGTDLPEDLTIPWIVAGPRVRRGHQIAGPVSLLDTAPTLAALLDLPPPAEWEGRCVAEALVDG
jgi:predicted AlkP superfamily pyrophosphatase or phosphodiesterase